MVALPIRPPQRSEVAPEAGRAGPSGSSANGKPRRGRAHNAGIPGQPSEARQPPAPFSAFSQRAAGIGLHIPARLEHDGIAVDLEAYELRVGGEVRPATPRQLEILAVFLATPRHVWNRDVLAQLIGTNAVSTRSIDVQLSRIRAQIGKERLRTVTNRGWVLDAVDS